MYRIALVQNQSEMNHYRYADLRKHIEESGYEFTLFTAHNVADLARELLRGSFECVIFGTNAFNDLAIYETVQTDEFVGAFTSFMRARGGCLVLSQIKAAQNDLPLDFLKGDYDKDSLDSTNEPKGEPKLPKLVLRNAAEPVVNGNLRYGDNRAHLLSIYPNTVNLSEVKRNCLEHKGRVGIYWHYFAQMRRDLWETLIEDKSNGESRPLVMCSKENHNYRIVLSSLLLDWQQNYDLLDNIICWLTQKRHLTAILKTEDSKSEGFAYFMRSLEAERYPHATYNLNQSSLLEKNVRQDIHSVVIADPDIDYKMLPEGLKGVVKEKTDNGRLKYIRFNNADEINSVLVSGKSKTSAQLFRELEAEISATMANGFIDGSFWSTVETLQALLQIKETSIALNAKTTAKIVQLAQKHDKGGSYDDIIGATEAFLWLRCKFDKESAANSTHQWLLKNSEIMDEHDKLSVFSTIIELKLDDKNHCKSKLFSLVGTVNPEEADAMHLCRLIRALYVLKDSKTAKALLGAIAQRLKDIQDNGCWVDLDTTASLVANLIKLTSFLQSDAPKESEQTLKTISDMIFDAIIFIQRSRRAVNGDKVLYPWNNRISTSVKCILAWMMFDETIDIPIEEIKKLLNSYTGEANRHNASKSTVQTVERIRDENLNLLKRVEEAKKIDPQAVRNRHIRTLLAILLYFVSYVLVMFTAVIVYLSIAKAGKGTTSDFWAILWKFWSVHSLFMLGPIVAYFLPPALNRFKDLKQKKKDSKDDKD